MLKKFFYGLLIPCFLIAVIGCGSGGISGGSSGSDAPETATITISPATVSITDGSASSAVSTQNFHIAVTTSNGIPLNDVRLFISYIWAVPNSNGYVQLYDGTTPKNSPMEVKTDRNGVYNLRFDFRSGGALEYSASLQVVSGSVFASADFEVAAGGD